MSDQAVGNHEGFEFAVGDVEWMQRAIELARFGQGMVEPNPMVGCVLVRDGELIGEGYHERIGLAHAEVNALGSVQGSAEGATAYVTLEPCSHTGKTPPCSQALIGAGVSNVFVAQEDPFAKVAGQGIKELRQAGIAVKVGLLEDEARRLNAPYLKRTKTGMPWMIAKYAMTLDGKIATAVGDSKWISSPESRAIVHRIRGRVDGILVGANTAVNDDPMLNARPEGSRIARRLVVDSRLRISTGSQLVKTAKEIPVEICCGPEADSRQADELRKHGVIVNLIDIEDPQKRLSEFLKSQVCDHDATSILVEGGGQVLGSLRDIDQLDELHVFIGAKLIGGDQSISPVTGIGVDRIADGSQFRVGSTQIVDGDVYVRADRWSDGVVQ